MEIRELEADEYKIVEPIFIENGGILPNPNISTIYAAFDEKGLAGFGCFQLLPHLEPFWIREDKRGSTLFLKLLEMLYPYTFELSTFIIAENSKVEEICLRMGMEKILAPVYVKRKEK